MARLLLFLFILLFLNACTLNSLIESNLPSTTPISDIQIISDKIVVAENKTSINTEELEIVLEDNQSAFVLETSQELCLASQEWKSSNQSYPLANYLNEVFVFYVKVKDGEDQSTDCVEMSIMVDVSPPKILSIESFNPITLPRLSVSDAPLLSAPVAEDNLSGVSHYEVAVVEALLGGGFSASEIQVLPFVEWTPGEEVPGLNVLDSNKEYLFKIRVVDKAGNQSGSFYSESWSENSTYHSINSLKREINLAFGIAYFDYNKDGFIDLFFGGYGPTSALYYYENNGSGGFQSGEEWQNVGGLPISDGEDFNGDGLNDILTADFIVLVKGNGFFTKIDHGLDMDSYQYLDFDGDGDKDLIYEKSNIFYFAERENMVFTATELFDSGRNIGRFEVLDVNEDGTLDVATTDWNNDEVGWFDGASSWAFQSIRDSLPAPYFVFGNFDSIGGLDVLVWDASAGSSYFHSGDGSGDFGSGVGALNLDNSSVKLIDLNGDAFDDILVTNPDNGHNGYTSDGDGTFTSIFTAESDSGVLLEVADFDSDGDLDILDKTKIHINNGSNLFPVGDILYPSELYMLYADASGIAHSAVADFNKDGVDDVVFTNGTGAILKINDGTGSFTTGALLPQKLGVVVRALDFNADGEMDIAIGGEDLYVYINDGNENFTKYLLMNNFNKALANNVDFRDINADGFMDFIAVETSTAKVFVNDGTALPTTFTSKTLKTANITGVSFINTGADEALDAVVSSNSGASYIWHFTNDGSENFTENILLSGGSFGYMSHKVADIDSDGIEDILYSKEFVYMYWLEGDGTSTNVSPGTGGFTDHPYPDYFTAIISWCKYFEFVDLDKDGDMDFIAYDKNDTGFVYAFLNDGAENFTQRLITSAAPKDMYTLTSGDFNNDGKIDILYGGYNGSAGTIDAGRLKWAEVEW